MGNHPSNRVPPVLGTPDREPGAKNAGQTYLGNYRKNTLNSKETLRGLAFVIDVIEEFLNSTNH